MPIRPLRSAILAGAALALLTTSALAQDAAQPAQKPTPLAPVPRAGVAPTPAPDAGVPHGASLNSPTAVNGDVGHGHLSPLPPEQLVAAANTAMFDPAQPLPDDQSPLVIKLQVLLTRAHASPGSIDGLKGGNLGKAIWAFQTMHGLKVTGAMDGETWTALLGDTPVLGTYEISRDDVAGPFVAEIPTDYAKMAELKRVAYRNPGEELAERFHMSEAFLRQLNPGQDFSRAGDKILVANVGQPAADPVLRLVADKSRRQLLGYGRDDRLVVAYPATIGSESLPSPSGTHAIEHVVYNAEYWYRPDVNFKQGNNDKALRIAPGPNNPIGAVWIDLSKPTYGIHGTPEPDKIDKTSSHGCVRLTNWDVEELGHLVKKGVQVEFRD